MRYGKLMLGTMVMASLFGLAACSQSGTDLSGTAGEQAGASTVGQILSGMKSSERVDLKTLEHASDLSAFKDFLAAKCPAQAGCDYDAALILYLQRTRQQESAGIFPATFPQVETVTKAYEEMTGDVTVPDPDGPSGDPSTGGSGASGQNPVDGLIDQISTDGGDVSIDKIGEMLTQRDPATAAATLAAIKAALAGVQPRSDVRPTVELLLKGQAVPSAEAVLVLKAIASVVGERAGGGTGAGQPGAGAGTIGMRALTPVVAALVGAMASQQVSWADIEELITKADPSGAANLADKVEAELKNIPRTSPNVDTAEAIVKGDAVAGSDAGATLQEILNNGR